MKFALFYTSSSFLKDHQVCPQESLSLSLSLKELNFSETIWGPVTNSVFFQR
jgi:hypothetical protein